LHQVLKHAYFTSFSPIIYTLKKYPWSYRHIVCKLIISVIIGPYTSCHILSTFVGLCSTYDGFIPRFWNPSFCWFCSLRFYWNIQ
jgi:hypothetical protein